jgi:hypothetical protein
MTLIQLTNFITYMTGNSAYPIEFPVNNSDESVIAVDVINGTIDGTVTEMNFQLMTRSLHPSTANELGYELIKKLHNKTNIAYSDEQVILVQATNPNPFYNGMDSNNNYIFTIDFRILTTV